MDRSGTDLARTAGPQQLCRRCAGTSGFDQRPGP